MLFYEIFTDVKMTSIYGLAESQSRDANPIENIWSIIKMKLREIRIFKTVHTLEALEIFTNSGRKSHEKQCFNDKL